MRGYFILNGQGGELDKTEYQASNYEELHSKFLKWVSNLALNEGDTIKIISAD